MADVWKHPAEVHPFVHESGQRRRLGALILRVFTQDDHSLTLELTYFATYSRVPIASPR